MLLRGKTESEVLELLAGSAGFRAVADDGDLGTIETPLFPPDTSIPDFLVLRVRGLLRTRYPIVPAVLVEEIDVARRLVHLHGSRQEIERFPERLPLAL